jgi:hypothetical protein
MQCLGDDFHNFEGLETLPLRSGSPVGFRRLLPRVPLPAGQVHRLTGVADLPQLPVLPVPRHPRRPLIPFDGPRPHQQAAR